MNVKNLIGYSLKKTQHALRLKMDDTLKKLNLTTPQYAVLAQLELSDQLSNAELARRSFITPQTMHAIVSKLEQQNLIIRKHAPNHGRILSTSLTSKGLTAVQRAHKLIETVEEKMTVTMSQNKIEVLEKLLHECLNNLQNENTT